MRIVLALAASALALRADAAVLAPPRVDAAPSLRAPSFAAPALDLAPAIAAFAAPSLALSPVSLAAPALAAPTLAPAPVALPAAVEAISPAAAPAPTGRAALDAAASLPAPSLKEVYDGEREFPNEVESEAPAVAPWASRPPSRLRLLSAEELGLGGEGGEDEPPRPPSAEPRPFLVRHYRVARAVVAPILRLLYAVRVEGRANIPDGPALIVPNHQSFLDPILVSFAANRPMRFLMYRPIYETYGLQWLFRSLGAIPISVKDPKEAIAESLNRARRALAAGESVVIFPEGQITRDGNFNPFRRGFERVAQGLGVPVVPAGVDGMWGSALSRAPGKSWARSFARRLIGRRRRVAVRFGAPLASPRAESARDAVSRLVAPTAR